MESKTIVNLWTLQRSVSETIWPFPNTNILVPNLSTSEVKNVSGLKALRPTSLLPLSLLLGVATI